MATFFQSLLIVILALRNTLRAHTTGIMLPLVSGNSCNSLPMSVDHPSTQENTGVRQWKRANHDSDNSHEHKNPKRRRSSKYHPERSFCSPCAIWTQSGSDILLQQFHPVDNSRHAGYEALSRSMPHLTTSTSTWKTTIV